MKMLQNCRGLSLLELVAGMVGSAAVAYLGLLFQESYQRSQARETLEVSAASQIQEFFAIRRKHIRSVLPLGFSLNGTELRIKNPQFDGSGNQTGETLEVLKVQCAEAESTISLPPTYKCGNLCPDNQVPTSVEVYFNGVKADTFPTGSRGTFPDGKPDNRLAASLCPSLTDNQLTMTLTYLLRFDPKNFEIRTRTEVFSIPVAGGPPRPKIIGTSP